MKKRTQVSIERPYRVLAGVNAAIFLAIMVFAILQAAGIGRSTTLWAQVILAAGALCACIWFGFVAFTGRVFVGGKWFRKKESGNA